MADVQVVRDAALKLARRAAKELDETSGRREEIPLRRAFVRSDDPDHVPPLARLVSTRGRGGGVPALLYVSLIWRCSAPPFSTDLSARKWASLLGLADPNTLGARRVTNALDVLEREKLVKLGRLRGEPTIVTILNESGDGSAYQLPSTATARAKSLAAAEKNRYFKMPPKLWLNGEAQAMSAAAFAMLLILLCERNVDGRETWWSTERFPQLFAISPTMRSKGTKDLLERGLLVVTKQQVPDGNDPTRVFTRARVRNLYRLAGDARPQAMRALQTAGRSTRKRSLPKSRP